MESIEHVGLVKLLEDEINRVFNTSRLFAFSDTHKNIGNELPPAIEGYIPDLVYQNISGNYEIIGEAKTQNDIQNKHTLLQLSAFIKQISIQDSGVLIVSVPPTYESRMRSIIDTACTESSINNVDYFVISYLAKLKDK